MFGSIYPGSAAFGSVLVIDRGLLAAQQGQLATLGKAVSRTLATATQGQLATLSTRLTSVYTRVSINGIDYAAGRASSDLAVLVESLTIQDIIDQQPNTAQFTARGFTPPSGGRVIVSIGARMFAGTIIGRDDTYLADKPANRVSHVRCIDDTWQLNKRKVVKRYRAQSASAIALDLIAGTGFSGANIQASLPNIDEITFTNEDRTECLTRLAKRIGAYWFLDYDGVLHFFITEVDSNPTDLTATHPSLSEFVATTDLSQLLTRVYMEGGGANAAGPTPAGETILPVQDASWYNDFGGAVAVGAQRVNYTSLLLGGGGTLVGPGAAPSAAPAVVRAAGTGIDAGVHDYAFTFVTGAGESIPSPRATITADQLAASGSAPTAAAGVTGAGVDLGVHYYAITNLSSGGGETTGSPNSGNVTPFDIPNPATAPLVDTNPSSYSSVSNAALAAAGTTVRYAYIHKTASGGTMFSAEVTGVLVGYPPDPVNSVKSPKVTVYGSAYSNVVTVELWRSVDGGVTWKIVGGISNGGVLGVVITDLGGGTITAKPATNTAYVRQVALTAIPLGPAGTSTRKIYRTAAGGSQLKLVATLADNTTTTYTDAIADASLGANIPVSNTADMKQASLTSIALGPTGTTQRKVYRTAAGLSQLKLLATIADNTTTTYTDSLADSTLGANVPTGDTSGLTQPSGQVVAGSTTLLLAGAGAFSASGGWVIIGNGAQLVRYTGISGNTLTGIPASGTGAIAATVTYGSNATASPHLSGIPTVGVGAILYDVVKGEPVNLIAQADDVAAQTMLAALIAGHDGIQDDYLQDNRLSYTEALARATAHLALRSTIEVGVKYKCRDTNTRAGRTIHVNLPAPTSVTGDFKIQQVTISEFSPNGTWMPVYTVTASSTRFSLEDLLRLARQAAA